MNLMKFPLIVIHNSLMDQLYHSAPVGTGDTNYSETLS